MKEKYQELLEYRNSIDNIDSALVFLLAERFKITKKVGYYKREHKLPAGDPNREENQIDRLKQLAITAQLDPEFTKSFLKFITTEVIRHHKHIRETGSL